MMPQPQIHAILKFPPPNKLVHYLHLKQVEKKKKKKRKMVCMREKDAEGRQELFLGPLS